MPASIILTAAFGSLAAATAALGVLGVAVATFAINVVVGYVVSSLFLQSKADTASRQVPGNRIQLPPATNNRVPVSYGHAWLRPIITDAKISTDQKTMWYVLAFTEVSDYATAPGERPAFGTIRWGDKTLNFDGVEKTKVVSWTNDAGETETNIAGKIFVYRYQDGSTNPQSGTTQSAIQVLQNTKIDTADRWAATDLMSKSCFLVIRVDYDQEIGLTGLAQITAEVVNPIDKPGGVLYDYLTNERYGCGIPLSQLDAQSLDDLTTYSFQQITYTDSNGNPATTDRYFTDGLIDTNNTCYENLMLICDSCDSWLQWNESIGKWGIVINKAYNQSAGSQDAQTITQLFELNDDNVIGSINLNPVDLNSTYNRIEVSYPDYHIYDQLYNAYIDLDDGDKNPNEPDNVYSFTLNLVDNNVQAKYLATRKLIQSREDLIVQCTTDYSGIQIDAGDIIRFNSDKFQWVNKLFRVTQVQEGKDEVGFLYAQLILMEYNQQVYENIDISEFIPSPNTGITDPNIATTPNAPTVSDIVVSSVVPNFKLNVIVPNTGTYGMVELWYARGTSITSPDLSNFVLLKTLLPISTSSVFASFVPGSTISYTVTSLDASGLETPWYFRARLVTTTGRRSNFSSSSNSLVWAPNPTATVVGQNFQTKFEPGLIAVNKLGNGASDIANVTFRMYGLSGPGQIDFSNATSNANLSNNQWRIDYPNISVSSNMTISSPTDGGAYALWDLGSVTALTGNSATLTVPIFYKDSTGTMYVSPPSTVSFNVLAPGEQGQRGLFTLAYIPVTYNPITASDANLSNSFQGVTTYTPITGDSAVFYNGGTNVTSGRIYSAVTTPKWQFATLEVPGGIITSNSINTTQLANSSVTSVKISADSISTDKLQANSIIATKISANAITANAIAANSITSVKIAATTITARELAANSIIAGKIAADAITTVTIAAFAVTADKILAGSITSSKIEAGAILAEKIQAGAITTDKLDARSVTTGKIAANAVTATEIAANAITADKINVGAVIANTIAANAITSEKIAANAVTATSIAANAVTANSLDANSVTSDKIFAGAITTNKIAANAITTGTIAANAVTANQISANSITSDKISANAVTANSIAANSITSDKLSANSVIAGKISANAITSDTIAANAVTAGKLAAGAITADSIGANSITAEKIAANAVTANALQAFSITSGKIAAGAVTATSIAANTITFENLVIGAVTQARSTTTDPIIKPLPWYNWPTTPKTWPDNTRAIVASVSIVPTTDPQSSANAEYVEGSRIEVSYSVKFYTSANTDRNLIEVWKNGASSYYDRSINTIRHAVDYSGSQNRTANTTIASGYGGIVNYSNDGGVTWSSLGGSTTGTVTGVRVEATTTTGMVSWIGYGPYQNISSSFYNFAGINTSSPTVGVPNTIVFNQLLAVDSQSLIASYNAAEKVPGTGTRRGYWSTVAGSAFEYIVGDYGLIVERTTGGAVRRGAGVTLQNLYSVYGNQPDTGDGSFNIVIVGDSGTLIVNPRSFASSGTFSSKTLLLKTGAPLISDLFDVASDNTMDSGSTKWVAVGQYGVLFYSANNGSTWTQILTNRTEDLLAVRFCSDKWVVVGKNGIILSATNPGADAGTANGWEVVQAGLTTTTLTTIDYHESFDRINIGGDGGIWNSARNILNFTLKVSNSPAEDLALTRLTYFGSNPQVANNTVGPAEQQILNNQIYSATIVDNQYVANSKTTYYLVVGNMGGSTVLSGQTYLQVTEVKR